MRTLRRIVFLSAFAIIVVCGGLLVTNFDPSNPTHRRYSSEPVITETDDTNLKGDSGEVVLSKDLRLPRNEKSNPRQAFCNPEPTSLPKDVECIYESETISNYRIPDFISGDIIADSKNRHTWNLSDLEQIETFVEVSIAWKRPLWIYVRHNTKVAPEYYELVESTGGRIIYYFQTEQQLIHPTDFHLALGIAGGLSIIVIWTCVSGIVTFFRPSPKSSVVVPEHKASRKARKSVDDINRFMRDAGDNARKTLDD